MKSAVLVGVLVGVLAFGVQAGAWHDTFDVDEKDAGTFLCGRTWWTSSTPTKLSYKPGGSVHCSIGPDPNSIFLYVEDLSVTTGEFGKEPKTVCGPGVQTFNVVMTNLILHLDPANGNVTQAWGHIEVQPQVYEGIVREAVFNTYQSRIVDGNSSPGMDLSDGLGQNGKIILQLEGKAHINSNFYVSISAPVKESSEPIKPPPFIVIPGWPTNILFGPKFHELLPYPPKMRIRMPCPSPYHTLYSRVVLDDVYERYTGEARRSGIFAADTKLVFQNAAGISVFATDGRGRMLGGDWSGEDTKSVTVRGDAAGDCALWIVVQPEAEGEAFDVAVAVETSRARPLQRVLAVAAIVVLALFALRSRKRGRVAG